LASKKDWDAQHRDVKPIYTAVNAAAAAPRAHHASSAAAPSAAKAGYVSPQ